MTRIYPNVISKAIKLELKMVMKKFITATRKAHMYVNNFNRLVSTKRRLVASTLVLVLVTTSSYFLVTTSSY